jgi:hypothetical protein
MQINEKTVERAFTLTVTTAELKLIERALDRDSNTHDETYELWREISRFCEANDLLKD